MEHAWTGDRSDGVGGDDPTKGRWSKRVGTESGGRDAVTNHRIIYKTGLIRRDTLEMMMDKVESVDVDQSILGRFLDFGDVTVRGTGASFEPLLKIAHPIELRNQITGVGPENRDASHAQSSWQTMTQS